MSPDTDSSGAPSTAHAGETGNGPWPAGLMASLEAGLTLAITVGLVYVIGGAAMWLRFRQAGLPADQAVALVPKTDLLVAGLRVMILPAVASAVLLVIVAYWQNARLDRLQAEHQSLRKRLDALPAEAPERGRLEVHLRNLEERERRLWPGATSGRRRAALGAACAVALTFAFVLPFSPGAFVWPVVVLAIIVYWRRLWISSREEGEQRPKPSLLRIAAVAIIASAVVSVARQIDPTLQSPSVAVYLSAERNPGTGVLPETLVPARRGGLVRGILITASDDAVAVGDPKARTISTYPRSRVVAMSIGPPLVPRTPPASLMSLLLFRDAWAWTPLKLWCEGDSYGWNRLGSACRARPAVSPGSLRAERGVVNGVRLVCPRAADEACRGFVRLETATARFDPGQGRLLPTVLARGTFSVLAGHPAPLQLRFDKKWETTLLGRRRAARVAVRLLLVRDVLGDQVTFDDRDHGLRRTLEITRRDDRRPIKSGQDRKKMKRKQKSKKKTTTTETTTTANGTTSGGGTPSGDTSRDGASKGGSSSGGSSSGSGSPEASATPTPTPEADTLIPPPAADEITAPPESTSVP